MKKISVLCPTRGRPERAINLYESFLKTQSGNNEILFCLQEDDPKVNDYPDEIRSRAIVVPPRSTASYWNQLAQQSTGDLLTLMGDDVTFVNPGWDTRFLQVLDQYPDGIFMITPQDGRGNIDPPNPLPSPHPTISRQWYEALGYFVFPGFHHYYVDMWLDTISVALGRKINLYDIEFTHFKSKDEMRKKMRGEKWSKMDQHTFNICQRHLETDIEVLRKLMK